MTPKQWMQIAHSCRERDWIRNHNDTIHSGARACQWRRRALRPCTTAPTATGWFKKGKWGEKKKKRKERDAKDLSSPNEHQEEQIKMTNRCVHAHTYWLLSHARDMRVRNANASLWFTWLTMKIIIRSIWYEGLMMQGRAARTHTSVWEKKIQPRTPGSVYFIVFFIYSPDFKTGGISRKARLRNVR